MALEPLCRVLEFCIIELCDEIDTANSDYRKRVRLLRLINSMPLVCTALRDEAARHDAYEFLLFYERVRCGWSSREFFLDGVPLGVSLFGGETNIVLEDEKLRKVQFRHIVADRYGIAMKIESSCTRRRGELVAAHRPADLPAAVPGAVAIFVARCRAMARGVRRAREATAFANCANANCCRFFYIGREREHGPQCALESESGSEDDCCDSLEYWQQASGQLGEDASAPRRFCCRACRDEHAAHLRVVFPGHGLDFDADDAAKKTGRARVAEALKLALKRNEIASRQLRAQATQTCARSAVAADERRGLVERHVRALNVDVGVLYAASVVAESKALSRGKLLPGAALYWRHDRMFYAKALAAVGSVYDKNARKEGVVHSLLTVPRFLQLVESRASRLF